MRTGAAIVLGASYLSLGLEAELLKTNGVLFHIKLRSRALILSRNEKKMLMLFMRPSIYVTGISFFFDNANLGFYNDPIFQIFALS